jgi:predicted GIY-YIG superfamily endonuclease
MFDNFVYIIKGINCNGKIKYYIGYTINLFKRIRQHNCEITGGAKATKGYKWQYYMIFANLKNNIQGLQLEWRLKHSTKKKGIINKINACISYINLHNKVSPKGTILDKYLMVYVDNNLYQDETFIKSTNILIFKTTFNNIIIEHLMS